jgi:hypothetical protein
MFNDLLHPWMLLALAAMAIPILIEWLFRRRRKHIPFPAMRYLMNPKKRRRVRLQDLLLLLVRTVVPGLLVVALARPLFRPDAGGDAQQTQRNVVIVLDGTYSMGQAIGQTTAFAVAQSMSQDILRGLPKDATVSLVYLGKQPELIQDRTGDRDAVHDAIGRAKVSDWAGRMPDAIEAVEKLIAPITGLPNEVYVISDLQRSTWAPTPDDGRDAATLLARLAQRSETFVLDTGGENGFNAYLLRFEPREKVLAVGMEGHFEVDVEAKNMPANGKLWLTLYADEDKAALASESPSPLPLSRQGRGNR